MERREGIRFCPLKIDVQPSAGILKDGSALLHMLRIKVQSVIFFMIKPEAGQALVIAGKKDLAERGLVSGNVLHRLSLRDPFSGPVSDLQHNTILLYQIRAKENIRIFAQIITISSGENLPSVFEKSRCQGVRQVLLRLLVPDIVVSAEGRKSPAGCWRRSSSTGSPHRSPDSKLAGADQADLLPEMEGSQGRRRLGVCGVLNRSADILFCESLLLY